MTRNKLINIITTGIFTIFTAVIAYRVYKDPQIFMSIGVKSMLFMYMLIPIAFQGMVIKPLHLTSIKLEHLMYNETFEPSDWKDSQLGMAYYIPFIQDIISNKQQQPYVTNLLESYNEEGYEVPALFKLAGVNTKLYVSVIASIVILFGILILPRITNDYTLYRGLTDEQLILTLVGLGLVFYSTVVNINTRVVFESMDSYLPIESNPIERIIVTSSVILSTIVMALLIGALITGVFSINIKIFHFIFNFELIGIYILLSPVLLMFNAFILKRQTMRYNFHLDTEIRNIY